MRGQSALLMPLLVEQQHITYVMEDNLMYLKSVYLKVNFIQNIFSQEYLR
jgi:hypothetical protein